MVNKILFDFRSCGMGNNGGTSTIVKSVNTLVDMGYDVKILDSGKSYYTWDKLKAKHKIIRKNEDLPDADVIIATGYKTVRNVIRTSDRCGIKLHWIRAWETWQLNEKEIIDKILKQPTIKIVNSICLQKKLKQFGFDSYIIRPGYDLEIFKNLGLRKFIDSPVILGGLYNRRHDFRKKTSWIINSVKKLKEEKLPVKLWMFGDEENPKNPIIDYYLRRPKIEEKVKFYSNINIWLAPTDSEGLHMPPAEAMLTGACVVGTNAELSGMQDYLFDNVNGLYSDTNQNSFYKKIKLLVKDRNLQEQFSKKSRIKVLSLCCREVNMLRLVKLIDNIKMGKNKEYYNNCEGKIYV